MSAGTHPFYAWIPWLALSIAAHAAVISVHDTGATSGARDHSADALQIRLLNQSSLAPTALPERAPAPPPRTRMMPVPAAAQASPSPKTSLSAIPPPAEQAATSEWTNAGADTSAVAQHHEADAVIPDLPVAADWNELAALLRIAIDHRKRYPQGALILGREGTARVDFQLDPIGGIEDVAIIASSGVHALDVAASQAVQGIAPFTVAGRYLNNAQRFQVDVVFSLD